ncbi:nuclease-related domain-containing protein [Aeromicrobium duanguangcaii]|uniref:nuclease-related domain-containing protein n=1 Tax=Aeromicrobium duanguangcaii TaxID=2968086 RepID=UPI00201813EF|nr:nuclease-related domain-containing protein [Aeromicrobium duanguangcaii]MCL3836868.1 NERD domain-containing protein [Aeromicrobium duanguangcaii]
MPEVGIVVIEVKGGSVWHNEDGWWQTRRGEHARIHPVEQVRTCKYAVRSYVARDPRWQRSNNVAWGHGIVTPYSDFGADAEAPDCPRWSLHDRGDQADLIDRLVANAKMSWHGKVAPNVAEVELIAEILDGRLHTWYDVNADSEDRAAEAERLSRQTCSR